MSIVINTNMPVMIAETELQKASAAINKSMQRLSTGLRINSAKDDPAGSYIASGINTRLRGIQVAMQNVSTGSSLISVAEGDLTIIADHLDRIKELATQYANDTLSTLEQNTIKDEVKQRVDEINRIAAEAAFNKVKLLDGSRDSVRIQIGPDGAPDYNALVIEDVFTNATTGQDGLKLFGGTYADVDDAFADATTAADFMDVVEDSLDGVNRRIATAGIYQNRLESITNLLLIQSENLTSTYSSIVDADIAMETSNYVKNQILQQTASAMLAQANQVPGSIALSLIQGVM